MESPTVWPCVRLLLFSHSLGHLQTDITIVLSVSSKLSIFSPYKHNSCMTGCIASTPTGSAWLSTKCRHKSAFLQKKHVAVMVGVLGC